jgi:hypothetical protein
LWHLGPATKRRQHHGDADDEWARSEETATVINEATREVKLTIGVQNEGDRTNEDAQKQRSRYDGLQIGCRVDTELKMHMTQRDTLTLRDKLEQALRRVFHLVVLV